MSTREERLQEKKLEMFETLIDNYIDSFGLFNCIAYLYDNGFDKEDLLDMQFDEDDINAVINDF